MSMPGKSLDGPCVAVAVVVIAVAGAVVPVCNPQDGAVTVRVVARGVVVRVDRLARKRCAHREADQGKLSEAGPRFFAHATH
jgi:hypothetical protein